MKPLDKLLLNYVTTNRTRDVVRVVQNGADINCADGSALLMAVYARRLPLVKLLCGLGASVGIEKAIETAEALGAEKILWVLKDHQIRLQNKMVPK